MAHRTQENPFTHQITDLLQSIVKDTNQEPDEDMHRVRSQTKELLPSWNLEPSKVAHGSFLVPQSGRSLKKRINELSSCVCMEASVHSHD